MKRFVALVLSLVMALSLCAPAWGILDTMPTPENGKIILNDDVVLSSTYEVTGTLTIDLNGHTISGTDTNDLYSLIHVKNGADLTIMDSGNTGRITYAAGIDDGDGYYHEMTGAAVHVEGALTLKSGTIEITGDWYIGFAVDVRPNAWGTQYTEAASFTMDGGAIVASDSGVRVTSNSSDSYPDLGVTFTMNCGTINSAYDGIFVQNTYADTLTVEVVDGTVTSENSHAVRVYGNETGNVVVEMSVTGGSFTGKMTNLDQAGTGEVVISGGTFAADVTAFVADNTAVAKMTDPDQNVVYIVDEATIKAAIDDAAAGTNFVVLAGSVALSDTTLNNGDEITIQPDPVTYTVSFDKNGGSGAMSDVTKVPVGAFTLPECGFTAPKGKQFAGWATDKGATEVLGATYEVTEDVTFYAIWKDVEKCTGDSHVKIVVEYSGEKATKVYCDFCMMSFGFVQGTEDDAKAKFGADNYKNAEKDVWYTLSTQPGAAPSVPPVEDEPVEVPVIGKDETIHVEASVSGTTATIDTINEEDLNKVIGEQVDTGTVTIDFSKLENDTIDTVEIPSDVVEMIAEAANASGNDTESLEIKITSGMSIEFNAVALANKMEQLHGEDVTISIKPTTEVNDALSDKQKETVGENTAYDISVTSGGQNLYKIGEDGGKIIIHAPYELKAGEYAWRVVVYYVDDNGIKHECKTNYSNGRVNWETDHLSVYMIGQKDGGYYVPADPDTTTIKSADTFDAGIGLYIGMSVLSAMGGAVVIGKKRED